MSFINKTRLILNYLIKDNYLLLTVFNKEERRKALILMNNYLLNVKEIKRKTVSLIIVLKPFFTSEN